MRRADEHTALSRKGAQEPDDIRVHARFVHDSARSILDQTHDGSPLRREMEGLVQLSLDLQQAAVALADAADDTELLHLPRCLCAHLNRRYFLADAQRQLERLRVVQCRMAELERAVPDAPVTS